MVYIYIYRGFKLKRYISRKLVPGYESGTGGFRLLFLGFYEGNSRFLNLDDLINTSRE